MKKIIIVLLITIGIITGCKEKTIEETHGKQNEEIKEELKTLTFGEEEKKLYDLMRENKKCICETISTLNEIFNKVTLSTIQIKEFIAYLHETYLMCYTRKMYLDECNFSNLMLSIKPLVGKVWSKFRQDLSTAVGPFTSQPGVAPILSAYRDSPRFFPFGSAPV